MSVKHTRNEQEVEREFELERMILFSDAVFAIAITLVVIDIKWPELPADIRSVDLRKLFRPTILQFGAFAASFFFIGRSWAQHLRLFRLLKQYDQRLINLNLLFLFFIVTFPFTASGISGHVRDHFALPIFLYIGNIAILAFLHFLIGRYIFKAKPALSKEGEESEKNWILKRSGINACGIGGLFFALLIVSFFKNGEDYYGYIVPFFVIYIFVFNRVIRKYKPKQ
jgi:uncharacterized membrane protein